MRVPVSSKALVLASYVFVVNCQPQPLQPQTNTWNSDFKLTAEQISTYNLTDVLANNLNIAAQFERTNWATGSVFDDPFYTDLPADAKTAPAGSILKVEEFTDARQYTIAPTLALSRIIYQSKTFNGSLVPVSAYILWPFRNRNGADVAPLISWGHGTSGVFAECAPSHMRNLWYQFSAPFQLALAGYAVVATDYAGLGVAKDADGKPITHQYIISPAAGNDLLYAAQAARAAFPDKVSEDFVVMGHSQGGGAAWGAAERQVQVKIPGYLGSVVASPVTNMVEQGKLMGFSLGLVQVANSLRTVFPGVKLSQMLTPAGIDIVKLIEEIQGCNSAFSTLLTGVLAGNPTLSLAHEEFFDSPIATQASDLAAVGTKDFVGPLLVIQATEDMSAPEQLTSRYVNETCEKYSHNGLHYIKVVGVGHVPTLYASLPLWISWIDERFTMAEKTRSKRENKCRAQSTGQCTFETIGLDTPQPLSNYVTQNLNFFLEYANDPYQVA